MVPRIKHQLIEQYVFSLQFCHKISSNGNSNAMASFPKREISEFLPPHVTLPKKRSVSHKNPLPPLSPFPPLAASPVSNCFHPFLSEENKRKCSTFSEKKKIKVGNVEKEERRGAQPKTRLYRSPPFATFSPKKVVFFKKNHFELVHTCKDAYTSGRVYV